MAFSAGQIVWLDHNGNVIAAPVECNPPVVCPDCKGTGEIVLFTSREPCTSKPQAAFVSNAICWVEC